MERRITVIIDADDYVKLDRLTLLRDETLSELVRIAIKQYLNRQKI